MKEDMKKKNKTQDHYILGYKESERGNGMRFTHALGSKNMGTGMRTESKIHVLHLREVGR